MVRRLCRDREPDHTEPAPNFHTHERPPAYLDGVTDAQETVRAVRPSRDETLDLLDEAWDARNGVDVTSACYDYWAAHVSVYRDLLGITPERDVDRRRRLAQTA